MLAGIALVVIAVIALHHPKGAQAPRATVAANATDPEDSPQPSGTTRAATSPKTTKSAPTTSAAPTSPSSTPTATTQTAHPSVLVLNNTSDTAMTQLAISRFKAKGWPATDGGSFDGAILTPAVYYDPDVSGAESAATELSKEFPAISRVREEFSGLPAAPIIVILNEDYS
ncbi:MAG: LytR family transcriptional regulator [Frankiales bacterium]|nr:LytR family transcriptional regulator [Frankiales bacterium]